jgi:hypothetical protein
MRDGYTPHTVRMASRGSEPSPHVGKNVGNPKDRKKKALNNQGFILGIWWRWRPPYLIPYQSNTDQKP